MPSSTSSSSDRAPGGRWLATWLLAVALAGVMILALESFWRARGHRPSIVDDMDLWSSQRDRAARPGKRPIVLLGASRMKLGFHTATFRKNYPRYDLVQLAVLGGSSAMAPLVDLSKDEDFIGIVIVSTSEEWLDMPLKAAQQNYVNYYHRAWRIERRLNRAMKTRLQERFVLIYPRINLHNLLYYGWTNPAFLEPYHVLTQSDRSCLADYSMVDPADLRRIAGTVDELPEAHTGPWPAEENIIREAIARIRERGGEVAFVRLPVGGARWETDEARFPRSMFWDRLAEKFDVVTVHFRDVPVMRQLECPDGSHLDQRDAPRFTELLAQELVKKGVLEPAN